MTAPLPPALAAVVTPDPWYKKYAKAIPSILGVVVAVVLAFVSPDSNVARVIQVVVLVLSSFGVVLVPNKDIVGAILAIRSKGLAVKPQLTAGADPKLANPPAPGI